MFRFFKKSGIFYTLGQEIPLPDRISLADKKSSDSLESGKNRLLCTMALFFGAFCVISVRLCALTVLNAPTEELIKPEESKTYALELKMNRADIVDRNGVLLATSLPSADLYVDAEKIKNPETIAAALAQTLPELEYKSLLKKLKSKKNFVYIKRGLTPKEQYEVNRLGFPQLNFQSAEMRIYPQGSLVSHIIGTTDVDNHGIAGIEKTFNARLSDQKEPVRLSLDIGIQDSVRSALIDSITKYQAEGAAAVLMNAKNGEIISMVSLPDYDPNNLKNAKKSHLFNTASLGVYEVGSIMKLFNTAIGLDLNKIKVSDKIDAGKPIIMAKHSIVEPEAKNRRELTIPEILIHSSNVGSAKIALAIGAEKQQEYLRRFGFFEAAHIELPEKGRPLLPVRWREVNTATVGYGYGVALTPVHVAAAAAAIVNGGIYNPPSLVSKRASDEIIGQRVISQKTSDIMRGMMRLVVTEGSGRKANVPGYEVGGKTGSAQKIVNGKYLENTLRTSFISAFPMDNPQYVLMVMLDAPKGIKETYNLNTAAWNAVPTAEKIIAAVAPQLGITPRPYEAKQAAPYVKALLNMR
ncbi:MAG: penicillin-binding protein 2 [Alphaproteobacteria bacterium]|nr:penicillin-binding protein 2 [Alphaproteobacteria bacterium]